MQFLRLSSLIQPLYRVMAGMILAWPTCVLAESCPIHISLAKNNELSDFQSSLEQVIGTMLETGFPQGWQRSHINEPDAERHWYFGSLVSDKASNERFYDMYFTVSHNRFNDLFTIKVKYQPRTFRSQVTSTPLARDKQGVPEMKIADFHGLQETLNLLIYNCRPNRPRQR